MPLLHSPSGLRLVWLEQTEPLPLGILGLEAGGCFPQGSWAAPPDPEKNLLLSRKQTQLKLLLSVPTPPTLSLPLPPPPLPGGQILQRFQHKHPRTLSSISSQPAENTRRWQEKGRWPGGDREIRGVQHSRSSRTVPVPVAHPRRATLGLGRVAQPRDSLGAALHGWGRGHCSATGLGTARTSWRASICAWLPGCEGGMSPGLASCLSPRECVPWLGRL